MGTTSVFLPMFELSEPILELRIARGQKNGQTIYELRAVLVRPCTTIENSLGSSGFYAMMGHNCSSIVLR
jgi:hypothetical protein